MSERSALIGWSGFVGGNLDRAHPFDARFRRADVGAISAQAWDLVVCAGLPAEKWRINADPGPDLESVEHLERALAPARIGRLVVVSTVDVYPAPVSVDESTEIDLETCAPYGRHRLAFERWAAQRFETTVLRLPGLFGPGLRKNAVFDLLHDNRLDLLHADAVLQWYPVRRLWDDITVTLRAGLSLVNLATEPMPISALARHVTGRPFAHRPPTVRPARYDVRTLHAVVFGATGSYLLTADEVGRELADFATSEATR